MHLSRKLFVATLATLGGLALPGAGSVAAQAPQVITVKATDFRFDAPASATAGPISFRLVNSGKEVHHLWLVQLRGGKTFDDFIKAMEASGAPRMPEWAVDVGGPNEASPNVTAEATMTLEPGRYAMVCYVPSPDGRPHVMKGMTRELTITASASAATASEPTPDVTVRMTDYAFDISRPITAGSRVIRIDNNAPQSHELVIGRLAAGKTMRQALTWLNGGQKGPAPVEAIGGASGLAKGRHQFITVNFTPGRYVFLCFIPDVKDGKSHADHGMAKEITVASVTAAR